MSQITEANSNSLISVYILSLGKTLGTHRVIVHTKYCIIFFVYLFDLELVVMSQNVRKIWYLAFKHDSMLTV